MPTDMNARELGRWMWRQVTSMRTALVLLLLLALAAIPGSIVPQEDVDSLGASRWRDAHPKLTPVYEKLGLFSVYDSPWFSAIYILLMISLVGCIVPRTAVYWRALRAKPPRAPKNLSRLPEHAAYTTDDAPEVVLERAAAELKRRRYRVVVGEDSRLGREGLPARGGQPRLPPLRARGAGRLRHRRAVRLQGRRDRGRGAGLLQRPDAVRRLRPGQPVQGRGPRAVHVHDQGLRGRLADRGPAGRDGAQVRQHAGLPGDAGLGGQELRAQGQPPADHRQHRGVPDRARLRAAHHDPGRQRRRGLQRADDLPADRPDLPVLRRRTCARRAAGRDRAGGRVLPDVRARRRHAEVELRRPRQPAADAVGLHRRPRAQRRLGTVGLRARQGQRGAGDEEGRPAVPSRPARGRHGQAARRTGLGHLRGHRALEQDPDQPYPRQADRPHRRRARARRPAGLALHPAPPGVGADPT